MFKKKKNKTKKEKASESDEREKTEKKSSKQETDSFLHRDVKKSVASVLLIVFALVFLLSLIGKAGMAGEYLDKALKISFGWGRFALPLLMVILGVVYFRRYRKYRYYLTTGGALFFFVFLLVLLHGYSGLEEMKQMAEDGKGGGFLGFALAYPLFKYFGSLAAFILSSGFLLVGLILTFNFPLNKFFGGFRDWYLSLISKIKTKKMALETEKEDTESQEEEQVKEEKKEDNIKEDTIRFADEDKDEANEEEDLAEDDKEAYSIHSKERQRAAAAEGFWKLPPPELLTDSAKREKPKNLEERAQDIIKTLEEFGIKVYFKGYHLGPSVIQYTFEPARGIKISRILSHQDDLALKLATPSIRIEAPIPGKSLIGVEVPLPQGYSAEVRVKNSIVSKEFRNHPSKLAIALGEDVHGELVFADIRKMPHLMVAGATNMGKSVCINTTLTSLLYRNTPEDLKLILIDPKRVELNLYNGIPHLMSPVITDISKVVNALKWAVNTMEERYKVLEEIGVRDIQSYNEKVKRGKKRQVEDEETGKYYYERLEKMPYVVIIIDELNDLMAVHGKEVEGLIVRIAQKARAVGIHLIISTQKPSVDIITGQIKANVPTRIALKVSSQVDSRIILDRAGAEKLLGRGICFSPAMKPTT